MLIKIKLALLSPIWLWRIRKVRSLWKKVKTGKKDITPQYRNDLILFYAKRLLKTFNTNIKVVGKENLLKNPSLIVANHKSVADPFLLFYALENKEKTQDEVNPILTFVAKKELSKSRINKWILGSIDTFFIDRQKIREALKTMDEFGRFVRENRTTGVIFPEGTRVQESHIGEFKAGAFQVAKQFSLPIIPITINNSQDVFNTKRTKKIDVEIIIHKPIKSLQVSSQNIQALAKQTQSIIAKSYKNFGDK
ncbi:lysophospholipid acyltransferase family protein [Mesomycoplasma conjunctivae]|uniref:lysophospholipid acyltransferase family protein n=1 Tax=Mesomycoplasma conjunctivae TaxID=45361 RepID=UPI003DA5142E